MHRDLLETLGDRVRDRATNVVWVQWAALGSGASSNRAVASVIDPEALVLASLGLVDHERNLVELLSWWAGEGAGLLSVQRMRNLSSGYPERVRHRLSEFAGYAWKVGGDHRWKALSVEAVDVSPEAVERPARLAGPGSVLLRLRLGLGVGIKADLLAALLGLEGWWTVRAVTEATGYTPRAVRRACGELARGGWIEASPASPAEYRAVPARWLDLLELESAAPWRHWHAQLAFVLALDDWLRGGAWREESLEAAERSARTLVDGHRPAFKWAGVPVPEPVSRPGAEYIRGFETAVLELARSMESAV
ncbi:MAG: hypothetical protein R6U63_01790 [Longimicrobiales bacterium]